MWWCVGWSGGWGGSVNCSFNECRSLCDSGCCEEELEKRNASASRCWFFTPLWFSLTSTSHKYLVLPFQGQHAPQLWLSAPLLTLIIHFVCSDRLFFLFCAPVVFLTILLYLKKEIFLSLSDDHRLICTLCCPQLFLLIIPILCIHFSQPFSFHSIHDRSSLHKVYILCWHRKVDCAKKMNRLDQWCLSFCAAQHIVDTRAVE